MELSVKKTDYRFSANNLDYLPECNYCQNCGEFSDDDHYEHADCICTECYNKLQEEDEL